MRKQSAETKLRHAKAEEKACRLLIASLIEEVQARRQCGQMMSNLCFNLAQSAAQDANTRRVMKECADMWDAIKGVKL